MQQRTRRVDNSDAYHTIGWILSNAVDGFYIVAAPSHMQRKIAELYKTSKIAIYDYSQNAKPYSYSKLSEWAQAHEDEDVFFLLNMQLAFMNEAGVISEEIMLSFNMSRDLLANCGKVWFFFMTEEADYRLSTFAHDIYSYVSQKAFFQDEEESDFEGKYILRDDNYYDYAQIKETLLRYKELEDKYMGLSLEDTPDNQLLSAAVTMSNIAKLYNNCAEYSNALRLFERVKAIREKVLGKEHPDTARTYNNIATVYNVQGDYAKALEWYEKALAICEKMLGKEHPNNATTYNNIANVYSVQGDYTKALEWYEKALAIREKVLGKEHPNTAATYHNIAVVYNVQGDYAKALEWNEKALAICEKVLGKEHPNSAQTYNNIAHVYFRQGDYTKALEWYEKALSIREKVLGKEHPNTVATYNNIAAVYDAQGDYAKAKALEWRLKNGSS